MTDDLTRKLLAEFLGTFALVFLAVGTAVVAGAADFGLVAVALAFGLVLVFGACAFGPVSGCHANPAVTIAMIINRRVEPWWAGSTSWCSSSEQSPGPLCCGSASSTSM